MEANSPARITTIADLFIDQVRRTPQAPAVVAPGVRLTYAELGARVFQLAQHLHKQGLRPEEVVAVSTPRPDPHRRPHGLLLLRHVVGGTAVAGRVPPRAHLRRGAAHEMRATVTRTPGGGCGMRKMSLNDRRQVVKVQLTERLLID
ncbi:AMP-binding protein [Nonomuraea sp. B1E8]|uniref:AMP-binding protein n=1 Tax=unclassified Nonomuraea TaxID=2593643 RepID=UPI00325C7C28